MRSHRLLRVLAVAALVATGLAAPPRADAQTRSADDEREQALVEALRREDPAAADRYVTLRDARAQAIADLRKVEAQYNGAGPELRGLFARGLRQARQKYAETSLALLDFFDARDRSTIGRYQEEIGRINAALEERQKTRAELEKLRAP